MKGIFENKLSDEGITLPDAPAPAANYVPYVQVGNVLYVSGQISQNASGLILGKLGDNMTTEQGAKAAKFCAISLLAQVKSACDGDLDRLVRVIKLTGFVNSTPDFTQQPQVIMELLIFLEMCLGTPVSTLELQFLQIHCHSA